MEKQSELGRLIDAVIAARLETGEPTAREVADLFIESNDGVIREFGYELAVRQIREMVSARMKKVVEINRESGQQFELPFDIEGIPSAISFGVASGDDIEVRYVALSRATEWHLKQYRELLRSQIAADSVKLTAIEKLYRALAGTFANNPGITVGEACRILTERGAA